MFKYLRTIILKFINKNNQNDILKNTIEDDLEYKEKVKILRCEIDEDLKKLQILKECTFKDYVEEINKYEKENKSIEIPIRMFIMNGSDFINSKLLKQDIFILTNDKTEYTIANSKDKVIISEKVKINDEIHEVTLKVEKDTNKYSITKYVHDLNHSTKFCKCFPTYVDSPSVFSLTGIQTLDIFKGFIQELKKITGDDRIADIKEIYDLIRLVGNYILLDCSKEKDFDFSKLFPEDLEENSLMNDYKESFQKKI